MFGLEWYDYLFLPWAVNKAIYNALRHRQRTPDIAGRVPQTAAYSRALPLIYGRTRITANVIQAVDLFDQTGGSEPKGNRLDVLLALCEGPIVGVDRVWIDKSVYHLLPTGGVSPPASDSWVADLKFGYGTPGRGGSQTLNFWQSQFTGRNWALLYPGVAFLARREYVAGAAALALMSFEVKGILDATGDAANGDAHPADILKGSVATPASSMLCNIDFGARFPFTVDTDLGPDGGTGRDLAGVADTSYRRYTTAEGLWLSPAWTERKAASDCLKDVLEATNATCLWTSGLLKILPLGDTSVTGNSVTYTPPTTIQYALTKDDFLQRPDGSRVELVLAPPNDVYNIAPVEFLERAPGLSVGSLPTLPNASYPAGTQVWLTTNGRRYAVSTDGNTWNESDSAIAYQRSLVEDPDPVDSLSTRGELRGPTVTMDAICQRPIALKVSRIRAQRSVAARNRYRFALPWRFARLQPLDFVSITDDLLGVSGVVVRIEFIKEKRSTYDLEITAVEWPFGSGFAIAHTTQSSDGPGRPPLGYDAETRIHETLSSVWTQRTSTVPCQCIAYSPSLNRIVALASSGTSGMTSEDQGETWTTRTVILGNWKAVRWIPWLNSGAGLFVAVGVSSACMTSSDGYTWISRTIPTGNYEALSDDGSSTVVAVGENLPASAVASSTNGTTWTDQHANLGNGWLRGVDWSGKVFAVCGSSAQGPSLATTDMSAGAGGTWAWTTRTSPVSPVDYASLIFAADRLRSGQFVAVSFNNEVVVAPDSGATWTQQPNIPSTFTINAKALVFDGAIYIGTSNAAPSPANGAGTVVTSRDLQSWRSTQMVGGSFSRQPCWTGRRLVVACNTTYALVSLPL